MKKKFMVLALGTLFLVNLYGCGDVSNKSYTEDIRSKIKEKPLISERVVSKENTIEKENNKEDNKDLEENIIVTVDKTVDKNEDNTNNLKEDKIEENNENINIIENKNIDENLEENINEKEEENFETKKISEEEARNILNNSVNITKYNVEINNNNFIYDGREYYQYIINYDDITSQYSLIVDKETGTIKCYRVDGVVENFEDSIFSKDYDESLKEICNWNGEYYLENGEGTLTITDSNKDSFNFSIYGNIGEENLENTIGSSKTTDNVGNYIFDNGDILNFIIGNGYIEINRFNILGETVFHGLYFPK